LQPGSADGIGSRLAGRSGSAFRLADPESGYFTMPNWHFVDVIAPEDLVTEAKAWIAQGVRLIGGCCGLGPEHVRALVAARKELAP
jgi:methionine synthase I (cobalamin-dependent)